MKIKIIYDKDKIVGYQTYPHTKEDIEITEEQFNKLQEYLQVNNNN